MELIRNRRKEGKKDVERMEGKRREKEKKEGGGEILKERRKKTGED